MKQVFIVEENQTRNIRFPYIGEFQYPDGATVIALVTGEFKGTILCVKGNTNDSVGQSIVGWGERNVGVSVFEVFVPTDITLRFEN